MHFRIKSELKRSKARTGIIKTEHGIIHTPAFTPVATAASVRSLDQKDMEDLGAEVFKNRIWVTGGMDKDWTWHSDLWEAKIIQ